MTTPRESPSAASISSSVTESVTDTAAGVAYPKNIFVMRHSELVDDLYGKKKDWIYKLRSRQNYVPYDLNMPKQLPLAAHRELFDYDEDPMITTTGHVIAKLVGRGLLATDNTPDVIYCSPALRCIETATNVRNASGSKALIRVEPALFENLTNYPEKFPKLFSLKHLAEKYPVDVAYVPLISNVFPKDRRHLFQFDETNGRYNLRVRDAIKKMAAFGEKSDKRETNVLIVAHASTVDMAVGLLRPDPRPTLANELIGICNRIPYGAIASFHRKQRNQWVHDEMVIPPITYGMFTNQFDHVFVTRKHNESNITLDQLCYSDVKLTNEQKEKYKPQPVVGTRFKLAKVDSVDINKPPK